MSKGSTDAPIEPVIQPEKPAPKIIKSVQMVATPKTIPTVQVNENDVYWLAVLIYYEAGYDVCSDRQQQLVAMVAINRTKDGRFRDTIKEVIAQQDYIHGILVNQYSPYYVSNPPKDIPQRMFDNATLALQGKVECPSNVIFQAEFKQGKGVYEVFDIGYSTTYFCFG